MIGEIIMKTFGSIKIITKFAKCDLNKLSNQNKLPNEKT